MDEIDLVINNYTLEDLLNLFKLSYNFDKDDLKNAKRIALKMHPDKSKLPMKFFIFFKRAYKSLLSIYYFRRRKSDERNTTYNSEDYTEKEKAQLLHSLNGKSVGEFNQWFNEMFDKVKIKDDEDDHGYEEWYKNISENQESNEKVSLSEFANAFERKKEKCKSLVKYEGIKELDNQNNGYNLDRKAPTNYSSDIFSKLQYEDLKKAHTETVVPVTMEDFRNKEKFNSVDSYIQRREMQDTNPLSLQQANNYLKNRENIENKRSMQRAYSLMRRDEEVSKMNELWWKNFKLLKN